MKPRSCGQIGLCLRGCFVVPSYLTPIRTQGCYTLCYSGCCTMSASTNAEGADGPAPECCSACWGAPFSRGACPPHFIPGKLHFKNKFCDNCRTCILVPLTRVRALSWRRSRAARAARRVGTGSVLVRRCRRACHPSHARNQFRSDHVTLTGPHLSHRCKSSSRRARRS